MNLKKSISLILASTVISAALSGAASAQGLKFAFNDVISAHPIANRGVDGAAFLPSGSQQPNIFLDIMACDPRSYSYAFSLSSNGNIIGFLGCADGDSVNDYTVNVFFNAGVPNEIQQQINVVPNFANGVIQVDFIPQSLNMRMPGWCSGVIQIRSNTSGIAKTVKFDCHFM